MFTLLKFFGAFVSFMREVLDFVRIKQAKQSGRDEQALDQERETVETISRNLEGQQSVEGMTEEQLRDYLTKP